MIFDQNPTNRFSNVTNLPCVNKNYYSIYIALLQSSIIRPETHGDYKDIVSLAPVSVHADYLRRGIGSAMIKLGIEKVRGKGFKGIIVEENYKFYNTVSFRTSSEYGIYPVSGYPMTEPRCRMCMETSPCSLKNKGGYVVYDMYNNA